MDPHNFLCDINDFYRNFPVKTDVRLIENGVENYGVLLYSFTSIFIDPLNPKNFA